MPGRTLSVLMRAYISERMSAWIEQSLLAARVGGVWQVGEEHHLRHLGPAAAVLHPSLQHGFAGLPSFMPSLLLAPAQMSDNQQCRVLDMLAKQAESLSWNTRSGISDNSCAGVCRVHKTGAQSGALPSGSGSSKARLARQPRATARACMASPPAMLSSAPSGQMHRCLPGPVPASKAQERKCMFSRNPVLSCGADKQSPEGSSG